MWYVYTMEYYSAMKKKAFESVLVRYMNLESVTQREVKSERERQKLILVESRKMVQMNQFAGQK